MQFYVAMSFCQNDHHGCKCCMKSSNKKIQVAFHTLKCYCKNILSLSNCSLLNGTQIGSKSIHYLVNGTKIGSKSSGTLTLPFPQTIPIDSIQYKTPISLRDWLSRQQEG